MVYVLLVLAFVGGWLLTTILVSSRESELMMKNAELREIIKEVRKELEKFKCS